MDERDQAEREQVVGGVLPRQDDAAGDFAQTDPSGGPGWRPSAVDRRSEGVESDVSGARDEATGAPPDETASGGYGSGSGLGTSGGSQSGGENLSTGSATTFMRGGANALDTSEAGKTVAPGAGRDRADRDPNAGELADDGYGRPDRAIPPDVAGE